MGTFGQEDETQPVDMMGESLDSESSVLRSIAKIQKENHGDSHSHRK
jgi:hypothetical protein